MSVDWAACGTCYSKKEGTELGGIELQRSSQFFQVGDHQDHLRGHPEVVPAEALWLTRSYEITGLFLRLKTWLPAY